MPDAIITSTESTFGTISGTFAADQSTISGTVTGIVAGTLSGSVGVPGPAGAAGAPGQGVPAGGTSGQYLQKTSGADYATDWVTVNLAAYAPLNSPLFTGDPRGPTAALGDNDTSLATTAFVQQELLSGTANAKNLEVYVRNQTGSTISAGSIVYINGATGNRPTITLAQANNDANSAQTFGFTKTSIANNGFGYVIVRGELENIDTSALTEGVQLYLSPTTAGTWTTTKPSAPQHLVYVGICVRAHPTQGVILVAVQNGYELPELHDVKITSPTNGQVLKYDSAQSLWVNGTDSAGVAWGGITGTLSSQTDLQSALDAKLAVTTAASTYYLQTNPSGFITSSALTPYLTSATAASTYQTLSGMSSYLTTASAASTYQTISGMSSYATTASLANYAPLAGATFTGKVVTAASTTANAGFNIAHGAAPTSPVNGDIWTTTSGLFMRQNGATRQYVDLDGTQTINGTKTFSNANLTFGNSTAAGTINVGTGATISGATKAVNIGTSGVAGSTTNITIGSTTGTSTTTLQGITNGVTQSAGDSSLKLATTAFVTTADNLKANLASPTFTGVPAAPTATAGTNTTQIATTAFVQAAVPGFATLMESRQFTNTTKAMSPRNVFWAIQSQDSITIRRPSFTYTTSGTIQYNQVGEASNAIRLSTTAASSCFGRPFGTSQVDQVGALLFRENFSGNYLFGRALFLSGRAGIQGLADSTLTLAFYFGKAEGDAIGDLTRRGYGWKVVGGAGSRFISLEMHNGTTLTSTASSFAVTDNVCFDWDIYADGTGNVTLYINGSQVATVSGGPTNYNGYTPAWWREEFGSSATPTAAFPTAFFSRGKLTQLNFQ
jgi:hypothetical protein